MNIILSYYIRNSFMYCTRISAVDPTIFSILKQSGPAGIYEGEQSPYLIWLNRQIYSDVYLDIMSDKYSEVINSRFVFNSTNWNETQEVYIYGVDDVIDHDDIYGSMLMISTASENPLYVSQDFVQIIIMDTDERELSVYHQHT